MTLFGKLEGELEIKADAASFHDVLGCRPHQTPTASPSKVLACDLHEGDWGNSSSITNWSYVHDGKTKTAKANVVAIDDVNNSITYNIFEGDLMEELKSFVVTVKATAKGDGKGSLVQWTFEYEKLNADVADPLSLLQFAIHVSKDIDAHLCPE